MRLIPCSHTACQFNVNQEQVSLALRVETVETTTHKVVIKKEKEKSKFGFKGYAGFILGQTQ